MNEERIIKKGDEILVHADTMYHGSFEYACAYTGETQESISVYDIITGNALYIKIKNSIAWHMGSPEDCYIRVGKITQVSFPEPAEEPCPCKCKNKKVETVDVKDLSDDLKKSLEQKRLQEWKQKADSCDFINTVVEKVEKLREEEKKQREHIKKKDGRKRNNMKSEGYLSFDDGFKCCSSTTYEMDDAPVIICRRTYRNFEPLESLIDNLFWGE